ncbi:hypothetical protein HAX54_000130, partial [Datura stramonium]|nr:hypothetical protein [Datura stramonium]
MEKPIACQPSDGPSIWHSGSDVRGRPWNFEPLLVKGDDKGDRPSGILWPITATIETFSDT